MVLECSGVNQQPSTFWSVTLQPLGADQAAIHQMKGDIHGFHMRHKSLIWHKRLLSYMTNPLRNIHTLVLRDGWTYWLIFTKVW